MSAPTKKDVIIKYTSLVVLVLQNTSLVLFMKFAMSGNRAKFLKTITVFFGEVFKFVASIILVMLEEKSVFKGFYVIYDQFVNHYKDALKVLIPAGVYTVQNFLLYVAVGHLPSATFMVTYQLKILTTAIFTRLVLKRRLSNVQWLSLVALFAGIVMVQYDQKRSEDAEKEAKLAQLMTTLAPTQDMSALNSTVAAMLEEAKAESEGFSIVALLKQPSTLGFISVLVACCLSGFAGIYFEKILKTSDVSIWVRNIQLALPSIFLGLLFAFVKDNDAIFGDGINPAVVWERMLVGFDWAVWVTVGISAFGGLVVAVVIKFADNILKAFATSFAIVLNCILSYFLFDFKPSLLFVQGAALVIGAVFVYSLFPYRATNTHQPVAKNEEEALAQEMKDMPEKLDEDNNFRKV
ncbi:hypothetical protein WR25_02981 [Diploscapter pachys]|uniref:UDP-galactose transporter n=1 Tax=Diploscapter pachys TaxID=2018661 RepID=A0A2A2K3T4_9BILA|nr:hypothetical protein WR25_02981 [Diploscapter pachys]